MKILIDTHVFLWFVNNDPKLSSYAAELLESDVDILLSIASLWEIAIKVSIGKLVLQDNYEMFIPQQIALNSIEVIPINFEHLIVVAKLPLHHRDPFDRVLISQSIAENIPIISADTRLDSYGVNREW